MIRKSNQPTRYNSPTPLVVDKSMLYFFSLLIILLSFAVGYLFGKSKYGDQATVVANPTVNDPQPAQQVPGKPQISQETIKGLFSKNVIKFGKGDKKLLMVEVSDPSCPYCGVASGANTEIGAQMGPQFKLVSQGGTYVPPILEMKKLIDQGKADFVWIYTNGHGNGELGTKALYCAFDQGKFWQAHDLLMSAKGYTLINDEVKNDATKSQQVADFLASAVNKSELKKCLDSGKYNTRLAEDSALATSLGVNGTPGFYLNSTNFAGAYSWTDMKSVADAALK
ncbi:MAG: DsbA family protein [Candidatus Shapirobacteria bacterium]|nr:DsbA family protein [Candidatus Shapirobacteria bacterium]